LFSSKHIFFLGFDAQGELFNPDLYTIYPYTTIPLI
jgi:hypothetical protein